MDGPSHEDDPIDPIGRSLERCLLVDLETKRAIGEQPPALLALGAALGDRVVACSDRGELKVGLESLERLADGASWLVGHNILEHDLPVLRRLVPDSPLHRLPVVDTLVLSPLAHPKNPYHRLIKDYKLVRDRASDPLADARLAGRVLVAQGKAFGELADNRSELPALYSWCLRPLDPTGGSARWLEGFASLRCRDGAQAVEILLRNLGDVCCRNALQRVSRELVEGTAEAPETRVPWAYIAAWLSVAAGESVTPPWVRHRWPQVRVRLEALRETPCDDRTCAYCREFHDPVALLRRFFPFPRFRADPGGDGPGLQERAVATALAGRPHLVILPTGGGKSIGYQLPALTRHLRRGLLTVVLSPLQALMKDQVDGLVERTGTPAAAALYGLLTPTERGRVLERVRLGDIGLLYVSPEQLRNTSFRRTLEQREIGAWVFDEAHCLSKWGHDFRPDYLYAARFIRRLSERQGLPIPPVAAFTATAKIEVKEEILDHFEEVLGQRLEVLEAPGVGRDELRFEIVAEGSARKLPLIADLVRQALPHLDVGAPSAGDSPPGDSPRGCAVIYLSSRRRVQEAAEFLVAQGIAAEVFHAGLPQIRKRDVLDRFSSGAIPVVCATNAFGMGIDKDDVRLVVHADIPGSLEAYLQEAGRAGRDRRPARCVLIFDDHDIETQFRLAAGSRLERRDLAEILRAVRRARRDRDGSIVLTTHELLRDDELVASIGVGDYHADTKVRTAIAWLERAGFLERDDNRTRVFQGRPRLPSLEHAESRIRSLGLPPSEAKRWLAILSALINADPDQGLTADQLAELPGIRGDESAAEPRPTLSPGQQVLRALHRMAEVGLVTRGLTLSAFLRPAGANKATVILAQVRRLENALLALLAELEPDADGEHWLELSLRPLNQRLVDEGLPSNPTLLRRLLHSLANERRLATAAPEEGGRRAGKVFDLAYRARDRYRLRIHRPWSALRKAAQERQVLAEAVLDQFLALAEPSRSKVLVEITSEALTEALRRDLRLRLDDPLGDAEAGLLYLHEHGVVQLQRGLAVFRQAMTLRLRAEAKGRAYRKGDYAPLERHYGERVFQVHVMAKYARLGLETLGEALDLAQEYFRETRDAFVERWFADDAETLERATDRESFRRIVEDLGNPEQIALVAAPREANLLILAGPGAGKTRVVVHRAAFLLRVERVPAHGVMILCFNRHAAIDARRRLLALVGDEARAVTVQTYHGLAMRLTGTSFAPASTGPQRLIGERKDPDFGVLIPEALRLLEGESDLPGLASDVLRDRLLAGFSHILVDEYQDIDADQYALVSALAGRTDGDPDRRLAILAVGDDDQTIYGWNGANVEFIRRFRKDYGARAHYLVQCYRSSAHIVAAANLLISHNFDRMKGEHPIRVDDRRRRSPAGGRWQTLDPDNRGRVVILETRDAATQVAALASRLRELSRLDPRHSWDRCVVLARSHASLAPLRAHLESSGIPLRWSLETGSTPSLLRLREVVDFLALLRSDRHRPWSADTLTARWRDLAGETPGPWWRLLGELLEAWRATVGDGPIPAGQCIEYLTEALVEQRREATLGTGLRLMTTHRAKGLEFDHVLVADDWRVPRSRGELEEERRLFYVAMTRARETLHLIERIDGSNPHTRRLDGPSVVRRRPTLAAPDAEILRRRHDLLGPRDIFLDFAGRHAPDDPIHTRIRRLKPGDRLGLVPHGRTLSLQDREGRTVGALSTTAAERWRPRRDRIVGIRLVALLERDSESCEPKFRNALRSERWLYPLAEIAWRDDG